MEESKSNEPIRVLHILQRMETGGTQALLMNLFRNIDRTKVQFDFLVEYESKQFYDDEIEKLGGRIYRTSFREDLNIFKFLKQIDTFFKVHSEYRIVHIHAYTIGCFCLKAAAKYNVPVRIAHSHNNETVHDSKYFIKVLLQKLYTIHATDLFACSADAGRYLFKNKPFHVLKNAIDSKSFIHSKQVSVEVREELGIDKDCFVVGHVGRFHAQKNHLFLLDIFYELKKKHSEAFLLLVGSGELEASVREKIEKLNLNNDVLILSNRSDMYRIYQAMDVFVLPSLFEGLGIVAIEAQAAGLPCVCSDTVAEEARISSLFSWLSLNESAITWADAILDANNNPLKYTNMCSIIEASGYDVSESAKEMQDFYTMCIE